MRIILDDDILSFALSGITFPQSVREFSVSGKGFPVCGYSLHGAFSAFIKNERVLYGNVALKNFCGAFTLSRKPTEFDEVISKTPLRAFGISLTASVIRKSEGYFAVVECADKFIAMPADEKTSFLSSDRGVAVKTESGLFIVSMTDDFTLSEKLPCTAAHISGNELAISYEAPTTEGITLFSTYTLLGSGYSLKERHAEFSRKGNYSKDTLPLAFFERILYANDADVAELLGDGFSLEDVPALKEFVGESEIEAFDGKNVLFENGKCLFADIQNGKVVNVIDAV